MKTRVRDVAAVFLAVALALVLGGCVSSLMAQVETDGEQYKPGPDEATVVFMRPSAFGGAIQAPVYDVTTEENKFIGIVSASWKVAYKTTPGVHVFMVVGESADFLRAELAAGKTFYVVVTPRIGVIKARFSLNPVTRREHASAKVQRNIAARKFLENTPASRAWAKENAPSVQHKRDGNWPRWLQKYGNRVALNPEDGL